MADPQQIHEYLPLNCQSQGEAEYISFLWEAFESNYNNEKYQFAVLAYHMLYMSFVYFSIWKIKHVYPEKYKQASIFLAGRNIQERDFSVVRF